MPALRAAGPLLAGPRWRRPARLVPTSTAVPAAAQQQNEKNNDEKRGGIHLDLPPKAAHYAAKNLVLTTFCRRSVSRNPRARRRRVDVRAQVLIYAVLR